MLSEYLMNDGYVNKQVCLCVFIKRPLNNFVIITVYVDDLKLVGASKDITNVATYLKNEFEMKDLRKIRFCLGIQVENLSSDLFVHQLNYTEKVLDRFHMDRSNLLTIRPRKEDEDALGPEVHYLCAISALMYLSTTHDLILHL